MKSAAALPLAAAAIGVLSLLVLDGDIPMRPSMGRKDQAPPALASAVQAAADDLSRRTEVLSARPEVVRSLAGGGIAVNRVVLFSAARQAMEGAGPGSWIALTDTAGTVHAWWGDAPASLAGLDSSEGIDTRWSAMDLTLIYRRSIGEGRGASIVYGARSLPVEAPDFGNSLGLSGDSLAWAPHRPAETADGGLVLLRDASGRPLVAGKRTGAPGGSRVRPGIALALVLVCAAFLIGRGVEPARIGAGFGLLFLAVEAASGPGAFGSWRILLLALGPLLVPFVLGRSGQEETLSPEGPELPRALLGYGIAVASIFASTAISPSELGGPPRLINLTRPAALTALLTAGLFAASAGRRRPAGRSWTTVALAATALPILLGLALVSPSPLARAAVYLFFAASFELWARSARGSAPEGRLSMARLFVGATLLALLLIAPVSEQRRAAASLAVSHEIVLPDPAHPSPNAVLAAERATERVRRMDLARDLPAGPEECDLSDLAYRIWRDGERQPGAPTLAAYDVYDSAGLARSGFSVIPEWTQSGAQGPVK
ncbi:MAG TPA: hypothetical protein VGQ32_02590, partial [Thermoanaerobaculia bacterium]|nr:hypothetical protein [Thermoanaerobaculia bacterium]